MFFETASLLQVGHSMYPLVQHLDKLLDTKNDNYKTKKRAMF